MTDKLKVSGFGDLFRKFRLRSEIETLAEFGDLLADEGYIYETSLFTRWQKGERIPRDRDVLLAILQVFTKHRGIQTIQEANSLVESANQRSLTATEIVSFSSLINTYSYSKLQISLGNIIKDFRNQKGISYSEITLGMGWEDQTIIHNIENGRIDKPSRETIDKLCKVMGLKQSEKNQVLYVGGYLPTTEEIKQIRKSTKQVLESWRYPSVLIDFSWRIISENEKNKSIYQFTPSQYQKIFNNTPTIIEAQFDPNLSIINKLNMKELELYKGALVQMLVQFRLANHSRKNEDWYQRILAKMHQNTLFRELWEKSTEEACEKITKAGVKVFPHPFGDKRRLVLEFLVVPLIEDPRFEIEYLFPMDDFTYKYFKKDTLA